MKFLKEAGFWFFGTLVGLIASAIGIMLDDQLFNFIGLIVTAIATFYHAYKCWKESQWGEY